MSDEGDKSCPLCAEEMDLTDQQLKPCKCGYEICVWCWHHIMDMAEKDATEGRCPACRTPYNKEKIVGTAAKCERLVSEMNVEKKIKSQKGKGKTSEGKKQLETVRVIQRNLVYVVGLPLDFADEELLQRKEYFAQYGKVLKCQYHEQQLVLYNSLQIVLAVYITYSNEEEAVRCIQSVHGFALDGRSLRACFGTTKYCHAWLRNVPCNNQDCLYLHETGSQDDSFTKDEIISAYTRSRVQHISSSSNSMQRRSGSVLPPPADEYYNNSSASSAKPIPKSVINTNNSTISSRVSPPNSSSGKSAALPAGALWGTRPSSNIQPLPASNPHLNAIPNQKPDISNGPVTFPKTSSITSQAPSLHSDTGKKKILNNEESPISHEKSKIGTFEKEMESNIDDSVTISNSSVASAHVASLPSSRQPHSPPTTSLQPDSSDLVDSSLLSSGVKSEKNSIINHKDGNAVNVCSGISSLSIHGDQQVRNDNVEVVRNAANTSNDVCDPSVQSDYELGKQAKLTQAHWREREDDVLSFDNQRINDPEIDTSRVAEFSHILNSSNRSNILSQEINNADVSLGIGFDRHVIDRNNGKLLAHISNLPSGHPEKVLNNFQSCGAEKFNLFPNKERPLLGRYEGEAASGVDVMGESSILSNMFSLDFDPWADESITSPQNMSKFLGDTNKGQGSYGLSGSLKNHSSNQSRFSFAREGQSVGHVSGSGKSTDYYEQAFKQRPSGHDISSSNGFYHARSLSHNGLTSFSDVGPDSFADSHSHLSSNKHSASRSHISAPPGFSVPSRAAPPPGFNSHERTGQNFEPLSGNHMFDASSSLLRNQYQTPSNSHTFSNDDIEFIDPAILAVGKGTLSGGINNHHPGLDMRSNYPPQLSSYEDARYQSLLQRSLSSNQNQRFTDMGGSFSTPGGAYGIPSGIIDQTISNNPPPYSQFNLTQSRNGIASNGQWDGWSGSGSQSGNNVGFHQMYGGYEDSKIQNTSSGNIYNRTYGI